MNIEIMITFLVSVVFEPFAAVGALVTALFIGLSLVSIVSEALTGNFERGE
jgi:hypothetical protein